MKLMSMRSLLIVAVLSFVLFECNKDGDYQPSSEAKCLVGRYVYDQASGSDLSYLITYVDSSLTRPSLINDQEFSGDTWLTNESYKHIYTKDSLYIKDFRHFQEGDTYLTALLNDKIQTVVTTFPNSEGVFRYSFDYSKNQQVTVTLERLEGNNAIFYQRGIYYQDSREDVVKWDITKSEEIYGNDPNEFTHRVYEYTYDIVLNPIQKLVIPHFREVALPDVTYFNMHNRLTRKHDDVSETYTIEYGTDPMPKTITKPNGVVEKFDYPNCTN